METSTSWVHTGQCPRSTALVVDISHVVPWLILFNEMITNTSRRMKKPSDTQREPRLIHLYLYNVYRLAWWVIGLVLWFRRGRSRWWCVDSKDLDTLQRDGWNIRINILEVLLTQGWVVGIGSYLSMKDTLCYLLTVVSLTKPRLS